MTGFLYRRIEKSPATEKDFRSHRENDKPCPAEECDCWGLSVWVDLKHVKHALKVYRAFRNSPIVRFHVTPEHGVIMHTGSQRQPEHRTFWRDMETDFVAIAEEIDPYAEEA
jgi:hypothetical protein